MLVRRTAGQNQSPVWARHLAALLTVPAFILLVAAYLPGNRIKANVGHPMVAATALWALAHGKLVDLLLFGGFLVWATFDFAARARDRRSGNSRLAADGMLSRDLLVVVIGFVAWNVFVWFAHAWLFGVAPLPWKV